MPRNGHTSMARQKASCTTSSANSRLWMPKMRVSAATMRPDSRRNRWSPSSMGHPIFMTGRTSTVPSASSKMGQPDASAVACARSVARTSV